MRATMRLPEICEYLDWPNLERNLLALNPEPSLIFGLIMAKREHAIRTLLSGRVSCSCGWYRVIASSLQDATRMRKTDFLLDEWLEHSDGMRRAGL